MTRPRRAVDDALADALAEFASDRVVEVGVGRRPDVAATLAERGRTVTATDVTERPVPEGVRFVRDDVTDPSPGVYADADLVYALNCPPELQQPLVDVATAAGATWAFTTLGTDPAVVDTFLRTLPGGTLFTAPAAKGDT